MFIICTSRFVSVSDYTGLPTLYRKQSTGNTQMNGAISKVIAKCISHTIRTQYSLSAEGTVHSLMRYQQFASDAYCGAAGLFSKMASQQEKAFCVLRFDEARSVITVQCEFRARFEKDTPHTP
jgi:hypothetical protein